MKFLVDEDVPIQLIKALKTLNHDAIRVTPASSDIDNARRSKTEGRILISLDGDLTNTILFPPSEFNIIHIDIHPPYAEIIITAIKKLLEEIPENKLRGLIILTTTGPIKIS